MAHLGLMIKSDNVDRPTFCFSWHLRIYYLGLVCELQPCEGQSERLRPLLGNDLAQEVVEPEVGPSINHCGLRAGCIIERAVCILKQHLEIAGPIVRLQRTNERCGQRVPLLHAFQLGDHDCKAACIVDIARDVKERLNEVDGVRNPCLLKQVRKACGSVMLFPWFLPCS